MQRKIFQNFGRPSAFGTRVYFAKKISRKLKQSYIVSTMLVLALTAQTVPFTALAASTVDVVDFKQCANEDPALGDCVWTNAIVQQSNSKYYEGMSVPQRTVFSAIDATSGNVHTLTFSHQATKSGIHAYDWLTSYDQAIASAAAMGVPFNNLPGQACDANIGPPGTLGATCSSLRSGGNSILVIVPDDAFVSADGSTQTRIDAYETAYGDRTIKIYGNSAISSAALTLSHSVANGADTGDSDINYTLTWTSVSTDILIEMAGHISIGGDGAGISWGSGNGASSISGGPYHFNLSKLNNGSLGSQDNQIKGSEILPPPPPPTNATLTLVKIVTIDNGGIAVDT